MINVNALRTDCRLTNASMKLMHSQLGSFGYRPQASPVLKTYWEVQFRNITKLEEEVYESGCEEGYCQYRSRSMY